MNFSLMFMIVPLEIRLGDDAGEVCDVGADAEFGEFIRHGAFGGEIGAEFDKLHGAAGGVGDDVGDGADPNFVATFTDEFALGGVQGHGLVPIGLDSL